jgi:hypothetical protein
MTKPQKGKTKVSVEKDFLKSLLPKMLVLSDSITFFDHFLVIFLKE